jgi:hypothetical protein
MLKMTEHGLLSVDPGEGSLPTPDVDALRTQAARLTGLIDDAAAVSRTGGPGVSDRQVAATRIGRLRSQARDVVPVTAGPASRLQGDRSVTPTPIWVRSCMEHNAARADQLLAESEQRCGVSGRPAY